MPRFAHPRLIIGVLASLMLPHIYAEPSQVRHSSNPTTVNTPEQIPDSLLYPGLKNLGNTCFLNAALKLLAADQHFLSILKHHTIPYDEQHPRLTIVRKRLRLHLITLLRCLQINEKSPHKPHPFRVLENILRDIIRDYRQAYMLIHHKLPPRLPGTQQDPQEFIQHLMEFILGAKAASDKEHPGTITLADAIKWAPAKEFTISSTTNNYFLSVPTQTFSGKKLGSVQETVDEFFIREQVEGTREVQFAKGEKMFLLISAPPTLLIQLNRYTYDWQTMRSLRLGHPIKVEPVVLTIHTPQGEASEKAYYEPLAVEVHQPFLSHSIEAGHYYTYIKGTEGWICHDDARPPYRADDAALDINHNGYLLNYRLVKKEMITSTKEIKNN